MTNDVNAVIEALKVVLEEAQQARDDDEVTHRRAECANRWIRQLPGAWRGRWRNLILRCGKDETHIYIDQFIAHIQATIAYLEAHQERIAAMRPWSWSMRQRPPATPGEQIEPSNKRIRSIK